MRAMSRNTLVALGGGLFMLTLLTTVVGAKTVFRASFRNESPVQVRVDILHSDGSLQKHENIKSKDKKTFYFDSADCHKTKTRHYKVYERLSNRVIAYGTFTMTTDGKDSFAGDCYVPKDGFHFSECADVPDDEFQVTCYYNERNYEGSAGRVWVRAAN